MKIIRQTTGEVTAERKHGWSMTLSVNQLVREYLTRISEREDRARQARQRIRQMSNRSKARLGSKSWSREELHER